MFLFLSKKQHLLKTASTYHAKATVLSEQKITGIFGCWIIIVICEVALKNKTASNDKKCNSMCFFSSRTWLQKRLHDHISSILSYSMNEIQLYWLFTTNSIGDNNYVILWSRLCVRPFCTELIGTFYTLYRFVCIECTNQFGIIYYTSSSWRD